MNTEIMTQLLQKVTESGEFPASRGEAFRNFVLSAAPAELQKMNPLLVAETLGWEHREGVRFFIHAAKAGLMVMEWDFICPLCGGAESHRSLGEINQEKYYCHLCEADVEVNLDNQVEVVFSLSPEVQGRRFNPYQDRETYLGYHFSKSMIRPPAIEDYVNESMKGWLTIPAGEMKRINLRNLKSGFRYRFLSLEHGKGLHLVVNDQAPIEDDLVIDAEFTLQGFDPEPLEVPPCDLTISLKNLSPTQAGFIVFKEDRARAAQVFPHHQVSFRSQFTGKKLIHTQSFRDLFVKEDLPDNLHIKAGDVTILFTDLKGSTALYEQTGDLKAYSLVQQHFDLLAKEVEEYNGALIKTIGDAVMAAFSSSRDALAAAVRMVDVIEKMNEETSREGYEIAIKVGLHTGNAIAVNANSRLDYFGQTVNVAARVQGLAAGGEVWITQEVQEQPECRQLLQREGFSLERKMAELKGVSHQVPVYQCLRDKG